MARGHIQACNPSATLPRNETFLKHMGSNRVIHVA